MPPTELAKTISALREERKLSARALSLAAGLSESVVGQIERGEIKSPRAEVVVALARALGVDVGALLVATSQPAA